MTTTMKTETRPTRQSARQPASGPAAAARWGLVLACLGLVGCGATSRAGAGADAGDAIDCSTRRAADTAVLLPPDRLALRYGSGVERFSQLETSTAQPVEVCGAEGQAGYLMALRCDDGGRPFSNANAARLARTEAVGIGGRCGSVVDLFEVRCREGVHAVYIDSYMCPAD